MFFYRQITLIITRRSIKTVDEKIDKLIFWTGQRIKRRGENTSQPWWQTNIYVPVCLDITWLIFFVLCKELPGLVNRKHFEFMVKLWLSWESLSIGFCSFYIIVLCQLQRLRRHYEWYKSNRWHGFMYRKESFTTELNHREWSIIFSFYCGL